MNTAEQTILRDLFDDDRPRHDMSFKDAEWAVVVQLGIAGLVRCVNRHISITPAGCNALGASMPGERSPVGTVIVSWAAEKRRAA